MADVSAKLALEAEPLGVVVLARCDLQMEGCTAREPAPVTVVRVGQMQDQFVVCRSCLESMIREGEWSVRGSRIQPQIDFVVQDGLGKPAICVEVKAPPRTYSVDLLRWATSFHRNLAAHSAVPSAQFFLLLVVPEIGFLWSRPEGPIDAPPDYTFDLTEFSAFGDAVPNEVGLAADAWTYRALSALLEGNFQPEGLWWTESGLKRLVESGRLSLVSRREPLAS